MSSQGAFRGNGGGAKKGIPQGLKPHIFGSVERPKAKALGYLDAEGFLGARALYGGEGGFCAPIELPFSDSLCAASVEQGCDWG